MMVLALLRSAAGIPLRRRQGVVGVGDRAERIAERAYVFTRNPTNFCRVCERAVSRTIDLYAR